MAVKITTEGVNGDDFHFSVTATDTQTSLAHVISFFAEGDSCELEVLAKLVSYSERDGFLPHGDGLDDEIKIAERNFVAAAEAYLAVRKR